jgi:putative exporter of polyketide antibiotics
MALGLSPATPELIAQLRAQDPQGNAGLTVSRANQAFTIVFMFVSVVFALPLVAAITKLCERERRRRDAEEPQ